jgi:anaerobic dimethyl sulfoxide reductase subunit C
MNAKDWALIIYTILAQMSVGSFIVLGIMHFFARSKSGQEDADRLSDRALLAIGPVLILGTIASLFHLGSPVNSFRAVSNFGSSWLSREITFTLAFIVVGGVFAIMQWRKIATFQIRSAVAIVAAIIGVALVYSMAQIYMLRTTPAWDTAATPVSFFTTTFLLGALAVGAAFVANHAYMQRKGTAEADSLRDLMRSSLRWLALASVILVGIHFVVIPLNVSYLSNSDSNAAVESVNMMIEDYGWVFGVRLVLSFFGAVVLGAFIYGNTISAGRERVMSNLAYSAFALVLIAEVMGRFLFYATKTTIGI